MIFLLDPYRTPTVKVTSTPYPIITIEAMALSISLMSAKVYGWPRMELILSASVISGDLRVILRTYAMVWEGISLSAAMLSGELRQILKSYDMLPEAIGLSADLLTGTLQVKLLTYPNWDADYEQLGVSMSVLSGTLA